MRIEHRGPAAVRVVEVDVDDPDATVGDLVAALDPHADRRIEPVIDGAPATTDTPLSAVAVCEGSLVDTTGEPATTRPPARIVAVVGGLRAGVAVDATTSLVVGRGRDTDLCLDDPALSPHHLEFRAGVLTDLDSRNGTAVDGHPLRGPAPIPTDAVIRAGTSRFRISVRCDDQPLAIARGLGARGGTIPFNRPPRVAPPAIAVAVAVPAPGPEPPAPESLSVAGIVLPIVAGAVVAYLFSPFMAVFAALGPVLTIGTWWERRRRARRAYRRGCREFAEALERLDQQLPAARVAEITRRRELHPDPAEVVRRADALSVRLWERRPNDPDAFRFAVGAADEPFAPPVEAPDDTAPAPEALDLVAAQPRLPDVPLAVDLSPGRVIGIVGDRPAAEAIGRSLLVQAATHHGPADLSVAVVADAVDRWNWAAWLPHTADPLAGRRGAGVMTTDDPASAAAVLAGAGERTVLALLDGADPFQGRATAGRLLLSSGSTSAIVLVPDEHRLPARCDTLVRTDALGRLSIVDPRRAEPGRLVLAWGIDPTTARTAARRMARLDDPELPLVGAAVPGDAPLLGLLAMTGDDPSEIEEAWRRADGTARLVAPIGADGDGPVVLDFVADGPHVLIGGTTGSGKSELLRSLVAGVAAGADADHVAMVLVDYKGGAAFDCCADLPHVAGLVTDLDDELAARAMRCLEAELRYREHRLRAVGADDMASFRVIAGARADVAPLPRLLIVVDEFASLAADLPEFVDALVGIAQRGRSLGVHMVLATQRPAGVVTDDIRANTGCRVALRMTDRRDSVDVIDAGDAADIPRTRPGRAVARFGPGELSPFQAAYVTGRSQGIGGVRVRAVDSAVVAVTSADADGPTDLERLVATIDAAHRARGVGVPRSPWPPALPADVRPADTARAGDWLLVDRPDEQCQTFEQWVPADGHLVVVGAPGAGSTSTLAAAALAAVRPEAPECHLHVIDLDGGGLAPLAMCAHTGTLAGPSDTVRRRRLLRWLDDEVSRRRAAPGDHPQLLLVVDDLGGLARAHDVVREPAVHDQFARVWADGPAVGVCVAVSIRRAAELAPALIATAGTVLLHRTADPSDALRFGVKAATDALPPGRAVRTSDGALLHVVRSADSISAAVEGFGSGSSPASTPHDVGELRAEIHWREADACVEVSSAGADLRIAVADRDLALRSLHLHPGAHALVLGPPRSGRTTALAAIGHAAGRKVVVVGHELAARVGVPATEPGSVAERIAAEGPVVVLVDDAPSVSDDDGQLARLVAAPPAGVHFVVAARPDRYRAAYGHWSADIKASRNGLLLRPDPLDGDILGHPLPARLDLAPVAGRGLLVSDAVAEVVQVVSPPCQSAS